MNHEMSLNTVINIYAGKRKNIRFFKNSNK